MTNDLFRQVPANTVAEDCDLRVNLYARLELGLPRPILRDAAIACSDADDARTVQQHFTPGKSGEHIDPFAFDLLRQPPYELVPRDDEVAMVPEWRRDDGESELRVPGQEVHMVAMNRCREG